MAKVVAANWVLELKMRPRMMEALDESPGHSATEADHRVKTGEVVQEVRFGQIRILAT